MIHSPLDLSLLIGQLLNWPALAPATATERGLLATMASELGSNQLKYAGGGEISVHRLLQSDGSTAIELRATDPGPGIPDTELALRERYSTGGTLGLGLPGVRRMADHFLLWSEPGKGTRVTVRKRLLATTSAPSGTHPATDVSPRVTMALQGVEIAQYNRPCLGEAVSGDQASAHPVPGGYLLHMVDGTGHGLKANDIASTLARGLRDQIDHLLLSQPQLSTASALPDLLQHQHDLARNSPGAAVWLAFVDIQHRCLHALGVGNTRLHRLLGADHSVWRGVSRDGLLGHRLPNVQLQHSPFVPGDLLLLFSDGISEAPVRSVVSPLVHQSAHHIAHTVVEHAGKSFDDACCMVLKWTS